MPKNGIFSNGHYREFTILYLCIVVAKIIYWLQHTIKSHLLAASNNSSNRCKLQAVTTLVVEQRPLIDKDIQSCT